MENLNEFDTINFENDSEKSEKFFFTEDIESIENNVAYILTNKIYNNAIETDIVYNNAVLRVTAEPDKSDEIISQLVPSTIKRYDITTEAPVVKNISLEQLPIFQYHSQSLNENYYWWFLQHIEVIENLQAMSTDTQEGLKTYYPNILIYSKEKISVKVPVFISQTGIEDEGSWLYLYLINYDGSLNLTTLYELKKIYPDKITDQFIESFGKAVEFIKSNQCIFSLPYMTMIRKMYLNIDTQVKAVINVIRASEIFTANKSQFYRLFQESRIQDTESQESNGCSQIKYKGSYMPVSFKEYLGIEEVEGQKICPILIGMNDMVENDRKEAERFLEDLKNDKNLKPTYLYLYHLYHADPDAVMNDYDRLEVKRQQLAKQIWFQNFLILSREEDFIREVRSSRGTTKSVAHTRPNTISYTVHGQEEEIKISRYNKRGAN